MPTETKMKKWLLTVDTGDYTFPRKIAKELNVPLQQITRFMFKKLRSMDFAELKEDLERSTAQAELEEIQEEKERLTNREKELKQSLHTGN